MSTDTQSIPGSQNLRQEAPENSLQRVSDYPVIKKSLSTAYGYINSNSYSSSLYHQLEALARAILAQLEPLQKRLPIKTVDGYANACLDEVEKRFPQVKDDTDVLVKKVRKPADDAVGIAKTYADGIQSRISPVVDQFSARLAQGQSSLVAIQERVNTTLKQHPVPKDKASAQEALKHLYAEIESLSTYVTAHAKELPANVQSATKPLVDELAEGYTHIKEEIQKPDVPIGQKLGNILNISQAKINPILSSLKDALTLKKVEAEKAAPTVNGSS